MNYYFSLQYKMLNRHLKEFGINPILAYVLMAIGFIGLSFYLFTKIELAHYIYPAIGLTFTSQLGEIKKNEFLKLQFSKADYRKIRLLENGLLVLPFCLFLLFQQQFLIVIILLISSLLLSFLRGNPSINWQFPTPFYKFPYEFTVGFRNTFPFILLAGFLLFMAIQVDNFNLGIAALVLVLFTIMSFYYETEAHFFVWVHHFTAKQFIAHKIKILVGYTLLLCMPFTLILSFFYPENLYIILLVQFIGLLYPIIALLSKYATYPAKLNIIQAFAVGLSFWFPPLLLVILPYLYIQAIKKLTPILEW